jgi:crossover junction endodeoxyribonuclease RusA
MTEITFPWPDKALSSNARGHWRKKAAAVKAQRDAAFWLAKEAKVKPNPAAILLIEYCPPDLRRRDLHNMPASVKGLIDGIAEAMGCDDNGFCVYFPPMFGDVVKGGAIKVRIGEAMP